MALTEWQLGIIVALIWLGLVVLLLGFFYINRRYPRKKSKLDPVFKAVFLIGFIYLIHMTAVAIGVVSIEQFQEVQKYYIWALVIAIIFYSIVGIYSNRTIPTWKLWNNHVLPHVKKFWNATPYAGAAYGNPLLYHRTIKQAIQIKTLEEAGVKEGDIVQVFLGRVFFSTMFKFIAVANKHTGEIVMLHRDPPLAIQNELLGHDFTSSYEKAIKKFDTSDEDEDVEVRR